jgi:WD40 repeat protein
MITTVLFQVFVLIGLFLTIPLVQDKRDHKTEFVKPEKILRANKQHLDIFAFSNKEPVLISAGGDFTIRLWDVKTGNEVKAIYVGKRLELVKSSADGACVITYSNDNQLAFWNIATGKQWANIDCKTLLDISPDEKSIIALGADNTVIKVNTLTGKKEASFQEKSQPVDVGAAFICDGKKLLTWHRGAGVFLWNAINGERLKRIASLDVMYGMAISADEKMIAQVGVRNELIVADINSGMELLKSSYDD